MHEFTLVIIILKLFLCQNRSKSFVIDLECNHDITLISISPDGTCFLCFDDHGLVMLVSLITNKLILKHNFMQPINACAFSPCCSFVALAKNNIIQIFEAPGLKRVFNPFVALRNCVVGQSEISSLAWHKSSKAMLATNADSIATVIGLKGRKGVVMTSLNGHSAAMTNAFFTNDNFDVIN